MLFKIVFPQCSTAAGPVSSVKGFAFGMGDYLESEVIDFNEQFLIKQNITKTVIHPPGRQSCLYPRQMQKWWVPSNVSQPFKFFIAEGLAFLQMWIWVYYRHNKESAVRGAL